MLSFSGERFCARGKEFQYYYIKFNGLRAEDLFKRFGLSPPNRIFKGYEGMLPFWKENIARATGENIDLVAESVLIYAFSRLSAVHEQIDDAVFLMEHGVESVKNVAALSGFQDPLYFSKVFKAVIGQSPTEYIQKLHKTDR